MKRLVHLSVVWVCSLLTACILTDDPVVGPGEAQEIPGLAGYWIPVGNGGNLFLRANPDGSYSQGNTADDLGSVWRVQHLGQAEYLLEVRVPDEEFPYGALVFFDLQPGYIRFYEGVTDSMVRQAASKTGLRLETVDKTPFIIPGQSRELILATLKEVKSRHDPKDLASYIRQGGFVESGGETNSFSTMLQLLERGDVKTVIEMGRYLSDRGDVQAQRTLMTLAGAGRLDRAEGIRHGLRAIMSARTGDEMELANLYAQPAEPGASVSKADAEAALLLLATAQLEKPAPEIQRRIQQLSQVVCGGQDPKAMQGCLETQPAYWNMRAAVARQMQDVAAKLIQTEVAQAAAKARQQAIQEEMKAAQAEKQGLQAKKQALEIELCGRPGCTAM